MKIAIVTPEERGFVQYSNDLVAGMSRDHPENRVVAIPFPVEAHKRSRIVLLRQLQSSADRVCESIIQAMPDADLIHIQHEYGFFGSKLPGLYWFPHLVRALRDRFPKAKLVATAHTVIGESFKYPTNGRGWQVPLRSLANFALIPGLQKLWGEGTWGLLDGVICHSRLQLADLRRSGDFKLAEIPHYSPQVKVISPEARLEGDPQRVLVFGYITPEKGQDLLIEAMAKVGDDRDHPVQLVIAGGLRREADRSYVEFCEKQIRELGLQWRTTITGIIEMDVLESWLAKTDLVVAPFRETTGSGSLVNLLARGAAVLASDLPLNREIAERTTGALEFFAPGDPESCAEQIRALLASKERQSALRAGGLQYAEATSPAAMGLKHLEFYGSLVRGD